MGGKRLMLSVRFGNFHVGCCTPWPIWAINISIKCWKLIKKVLKWIVITSGSEIRGENKDKGFIKPNLPIKILDNFKCVFFLPC